VVKHPVQNTWPAKPSTTSRNSTAMADSGGSRKLEFILAVPAPDAMGNWSKLSWPSFCDVFPDRGGPAEATLWQATAHRGA